MDIEHLKNELYYLLNNNDINGLKLYDNKIKLLINEINKKLDLFINLKNELDNLKNHIIINTSNNTSTNIGAVLFISCMTFKFIICG